MPEPLTSSTETRSYRTAVFWRGVCWRFRWAPLLLGLAIFSLLPNEEIAAQTRTGALHGNVVDDEASELPGVTVTITGGGAPVIQVSDYWGKFRFPGLPPGRYYVKAELEGFSTVDYVDVIINVGRRTTIEIILSSAIAETITVTSEFPPAGASVAWARVTASQAEEDESPLVRDLMAIVRSALGLVSERFNAGGQPSRLVVLGSSGKAVRSIDGLVLTDFAILPPTQSDYAFDIFEEVAVTVGGDEVSAPTGGLVLNLVTRRGTNDWRGSARGDLIDDQLQSSSSIEPSELGRDFDGPGPVADQAPVDADQILRIEDYGAELGGPLIGDRLWVWGSYAWKDSSFLATPGPRSSDGVEDSIETEASHLKLNAQIMESNSASLFAMDEKNSRSGRGAGPTRARETTWNESDLGGWPTGFKIEDSHIFSPKLYLTALYAEAEEGFQLVPQGDLERMAYLDPNGVWHDSFLLYRSEHLHEEAKADLIRYLDGGRMSQELRFGAEYREVQMRSQLSWPGGGLVYNGPSFFGTPADVLALSRPALLSVSQEHESAYLQDTVSVGELTANLGVRYDRQKTRNRAGAVPANPLLPDLLPAVQYGGGDPSPDWQSIVPRLGVTYQPGKEGRTVLRGSYSRFADLMSTVVASWLNPLATQSYAYFLAAPAGAGVSRSRIAEDILFYSPNVDPRTGQLLQSNALDSDLEPPETEEILLGAERTFGSHFVLGLNLTYRRITGLLEQELLVFDNPDPYCPACLGSVGRPHNRSDYVPQTVTATLPDSGQVPVTIYQLRSGLSTRLGTLLENGDREQEYRAASLFFNRRLADRWRLRGNLTWSEWEWSRVPENEIEDPTRSLPGTILQRGLPEGTPVLLGPDEWDVEENFRFHSEWSYSLNGLYQIAPDSSWGFNLAFSLNGRQGSPLPYFLLVTQPANMQFERVRVLATEDPDSFRLEDLHTLDLRWEKDFAFKDFTLTLGVDAFNVTGERNALRRQLRLDIGTSDHLLEALNPRVLRLGARLAFR